MSDLLLHRGKRRSREEGLSGVASQASSWGWSCPRAVLPSQEHPLFPQRPLCPGHPTHLIPSDPHDTVCDGDYHSHFTDEKTEAQGGHVNGQGHMC